MSYFYRPSDTVEEPQQPEPVADAAEATVAKPSVGSRLADLGDRIARAFATLERAPVDRPSLEPTEDPSHVLGSTPAPGGASSGGPAEPAAEGPGDEPDVADAAVRFPAGAFGYNRAAVDAHVAELERELDQLRRVQPAPVSLTDEIERIGEQTSSILVVAHDQAHETTRRAEEQAERCIADAAANAIEITERATRRLRELDNETDAVWRERQRLLDDVRNTASALIALAEEATERFPEDTKEIGPVFGA